ncbi:DNA-deoxyinosine glycosylase [Candidatus Symbiobacter mobilis]|uniref:DNA-deoxyinosine glycosylase n=1 Tax=Candidatus Symbiobacter mobilis TaxID=1436290 RepID=UPI0006847F3B|nr:DNA-deoxyinosine glycosylase [Candidatus Symbiobacter mobilis]
MLRGLPPIIDERSVVLILGSFPSTASLAAQQYYAHPQNHFWKILGAILDRRQTGDAAHRPYSPLIAMDYATRRAAVQAAGIAIWDVYAECERQGSLDSAIRNGRPNDFGALPRWAPSLRRVLFNGQTPGRFAPQLAALGFDTRIMPSTSPANAGWSFERKLQAWEAGCGSADFSDSWLSER